MKFTLKLFCVGLIAAGLTLTACERPAEEEEEATAEETEEAAEEEEEAAEEPAEEEEPAAEEADADTAEGDAETDAAEGEEEAEAEEGAAAEEEPTKKAAAPQKPPVTGTVEGSVQGGGITSGSIRLIISDDYSVGGYVKGKREGKTFRIPFDDGSVSKGSNKLVAQGTEGKNRARVDATVAKGTVQGTLKGKIHGQDFDTRFSIKQ